MSSSSGVSVYASKPAVAPSSIIFEREGADVNEPITATTDENGIVTMLGRRYRVGFESPGYMMLEAIPEVTLDRWDLNQLAAFTLATGDSFIVMTAVFDDSLTREGLLTALHENDLQKLGIAFDVSLDAATEPNVPPKGSVERVRVTSRRGIENVDGILFDQYSLGYHKKDWDDIVAQMIRLIDAQQALSGPEDLIGDL